MEDTISPNFRLLKPDEAAASVGVCSNTLANWRSQGYGPAVAHIGGAVRYIH